MAEPVETAATKEEDGGDNKEQDIQAAKEEKPAVNKNTCTCSF